MKNAYRRIGPVADREVLHDNRQESNLRGRQCDSIFAGHSRGRTHSPRIRFAGVCHGPAAVAVTMTLSMDRTEAGRPTARNAVPDSRNDTLNNFWNQLAP